LFKATKVEKVRTKRFMTMKK